VLYESLRLECSEAPQVPKKTTVEFFLEGIQTMVTKFLARPNYFPFRRIFWKIWYNSFANNFSEVDIVLTNYGYADLDNSNDTDLDISYHAERYCLQLYRYVTRKIDLEGLDVLGIGRGRGGGAAFIKDCWKPKSMSAIDYSEGNIKLCDERFLRSGVDFRVGDAESLPFDNSSFDTVVNIKSSHCYSHEERFFREVARVLRPSGYFLFADFRPQEAISVTQKRLEVAGLKMINYKKITLNVVKSMDLEEKRKLNSIKEKTPRFFPIFLSKWFVGAQDTPMYNALKTGEQEYFCGVFQKASG
jgi:ubiquinone/menaquinone biosynthesis C-methylase UbiE